MIKYHPENVNILLKKNFLLRRTDYKNTKKTNFQNFTKMYLVNSTKFNDSTLYRSDTLLYFLSKHFYGCNNFFIKQLEKRIEISKFFQFNLYNPDRWITMMLFIQKLIPANKSFKDKLVINLNVLYLIRCYRGWRHSFSLPVRGQRTWSNAWSITKTKNIFKEYSFNFFKIGLTNAHPEEIKNAFYLEQMNVLWKWQWTNEWSIAFKKRNTQLKKVRGLKKLELNALAKSNPNFLKSKKQTIIPIGFEPDFTKKYLLETKQEIVSSSNQKKTISKKK